MTNLLMLVQTLPSDNSIVIEVLSTV